MKKAITITIFVIPIFFLSFSYGQTSAPTPNAPQQAENQRQLEAQRQEQQGQAQIREDQNIRLQNLKIISENPRITIKPVSEIKNATPLPNVKLNREQKILLAPDSSDLLTYAAFLKQPNTGLTKLFPDAGCEENAQIVRADAECLNWIPNSGFYSFRREKYVGEPLADIRYKDGFLISDSLLSQGIMTALGNVPLENISLADEQLRFLVDYQPKSESLAAAAQAEKITNGIKTGTYVYRNSWRELEDTTYALRVIAYRGAFYFPFQGQKFDLLDGDTRKDIIVVFRIIRKNADGSVTLLWKELNRKDSPKLVFSKKKNKDSNYQK